MDFYTRQKLLAILERLDLSTENLGASTTGSAIYRIEHTFTPTEFEFCKKYIENKNKYIFVTQSTDGKVSYYKYR